MCLLFIEVLLHKFRKSTQQFFQTFFMVDESAGLEPLC